MKKLLVAIVVLVISMSALVFAGCKNIVVPVEGVGEMETRDMGCFSFNSLDVTGAFDVNFVYSEEFSVEVVMQENLFEYLVVVTNNSTLMVSFNRQVITTPNNTPRLYVKAPSLVEVFLTGAVRTVNWDEIAEDFFYMEMTGAVTVDFSIDVKTLDIIVHGVSNFILSGTATTATISTTGASKVEARKLRTEVATINITGTATVYISCSHILNISITGAGIVRYIGNPIVNRTGTLGTVQRIME